MPHYDYQCDTCNRVTEVQQSIKSAPFSSCIEINEGECGGKVSRLISAPIFFVQQEAKTLGQQADRNMKRMSKDQVQEKRAKHKESELAARNEASAELAKKTGTNFTPLKADKSEGGIKKSFDKINKMTTQQQASYIKNGY